MRDVNDFLQIARRFFHEEETSELLRMEPHERSAGFLRCWTRKEAVVKAIGCGLSLPLDAFRVSLTAGPNRPVVFLDDTTVPNTWQLFSIELDADFVASLAIPTSASCSVRNFSFSSLALASLPGTAS
jgi:4'-phosphopantetheinyl transferase